MTPERQRLVLFWLLAVLAVVVGWRLVGPLLEGAERTQAGIAGSTSGADAVARQLEALRVADLELEPAEFRVGRDPFRFVEPPPVAPPVEKPAPERRQPRPATKRRPASPPAAQPPPVDVVYLGRFGPSGRPLAVFSDGSEIFNVFEGGVLKGNFVVDKIGYESADLKFVGFPDAPSQRLAVGG